MSRKAQLRLVDTWEEVWHPNCQPGARDFQGLEERSRKQKKASLSGWEGSVLDTSFLSEGGTSAFPPSDLPEGRVRAERAVASSRCGMGAVGCPASLILKEIQDGSTYHNQQWGWESPPLIGPST